LPGTHFSATAPRTLAVSRRSTYPARAARRELLLGVGGDISPIALRSTEISTARRRLRRPAYTLPEKLASGSPLGDALAEAMAGVKPSKRQEQVFTWFRQWLADGFFASVEPGTPT